MPADDPMAYMQEPAPPIDPQALAEALRELLGPQQAEAIGVPSPRVGPGGEEIFPDEGPPMGGLEELLGGPDLSAASIPPPGDEFLPEDPEEEDPDEDALARALRGK